MSWITDNKLTWYQKFCINVLKCGVIPKHIAFIMDGNRRFAKKNELPAVNGHTRGFDRLSETLHWCLELGVREVTVYAFSIENFKRSKEEVNLLMDLAREKYSKLMEEKDELMKHGVCIRVIGNLSLIPADIRKSIAEAMIMTKDNNKVFLNVAFSYTSREELVTCVKTVVRGVKSNLLQVNDVDEQLLSSCLYTNHSPNPDILIRTSGETRLSDFLLWQIKHSNIYFEDTLWPEFSFRHLLGIIFRYQLHSNANNTVETKSCRTEEQEFRIQNFLTKLDDDRLASLEQC